MIPPHPPEDWSALDSTERREALGALKARLHASPEDEITRGEVVRAYRQLGYPDQAGRFAIGLIEGGQPSEIRAYSSMLIGLRADESAARRLSAMPSEIDLPERVRQAIEEGGLHEEWRPWGMYVGVVWVVVVALAFASLAVTYGMAMAGARDVQSIAQWWTLFFGWALVVALLLTTAWCATSAKWKAALVWACATIVGTACVSLMWIAINS